MTKLRLEVEGTANVASVESKGHADGCSPWEAGAFRSSVGVGRAEPEWAALNQVRSTTGADAIHTLGELAEGPLPLPPDVLAGDLSSVPQHVDVLIVGAGLSGAVFAERCASELGLTSLVVDKRGHIGGNCYDYLNTHGIRCSGYGAHIFHTRSQLVWDYMLQFSEWVPYDHRVQGLVPDLTGERKRVPIPPVQETVNTLFGESIASEAEMQAWYDAQRVTPPTGEPANGEEAALSRVGPLLYERIFKNYTLKQWGRPPSALDASVLLRLPCRTSTDDRYFSDPYQALPRRGYTRIFENMLLRDPRITLRLNVDFFRAREARALPSYSLLVYTGPIDAYFAQQGMPKLEYRSLRFEEQWIDRPEHNSHFFQEAFVINHPSADVPFTRIVEYKHMPNQPEAVRRGMVRGTLIAREYPQAEGEPYYPMPNPENRALYEKYRSLAEQSESHVCFLGRLATYKYFDMDQAVLNALEVFDDLRGAGKLSAMPLAAGAPPLIGVAPLECNRESGESESRI
eukprot:NODE_5949_length_1718_cov_6.468887.p1 GENE.NODE_5949_length_1718_cov_6.468887~~NODE_5949_length_1718_cov_6.468887.p1  ORF type:complete len:514 (+),score=134.52 NODE_5949_length_1718_cov_6.468887:61-1602(+)